MGGLTGIFSYGKSSMETFQYFRWNAVILFWDGKNICMYW